MAQHKIKPSQSIQQNALEAAERCFEWGGYLSWRYLPSFNHPLPHVSVERNYRSGHSIGTEQDDGFNWIWEGQEPDPIRVLTQPTISSENCAVCLERPGLRRRTVPTLRLRHVTHE
jgi:hypothetical protein